MNYFALNHRADDTIGKTFPQSQDFVSEMPITESIHILSCGGKFPENVYVPDSILHPAAKMTDLITSSPLSMWPLISPKLKGILAKYRHKGLQFVPTYVISKDEKFKYWLMNGYDWDYRFIDFEKSIIIKSNGLTNESCKLYLQSAGDFKAAIENKSQIEGILIRELVLTEHISEELFFINRKKPPFYFISETVKKEIEANGCTGIKFEPL